jgi:NAD(P)-dependent dehydrogenase (short-subunit alcohol dehydrogenase family)
VLRPAFPLMCKAGYGRIVMASSINGLYGNYTVCNYNSAKAGLMGLSISAALEGAAHGVKSNCILPGALTRMADGVSNAVDLSLFPPMGAAQVAPVVAWLAHESCSMSGEMLSAVAGRVSRAYAAESHGVYREDWRIEDVAAEIDAIRGGEPLIFPVLPKGQLDHLNYGFEMARKGRA